jgi:hypothetical protein
MKYFTSFLELDGFELNRKRYVIRCIFFISSHISERKWSLFLREGFPLYKNQTAANPKFGNVEQIAIWRLCLESDTALCQIIIIFKQNTNFRLP